MRRNRLINRNVGQRNIICIQIETFEVQLTKKKT